jgi:hypothetical protein
MSANSYLAKIWRVSMDDGAPQLVAGVPSDKLPPGNRKRRRSAAKGRNFTRKAAGLSADFLHPGQFRAGMQATTVVKDL